MVTCTGYFRPNGGWREVGREDRAEDANHQNSMTTCVTKKQLLPSSFPLTDSHSPLVVD